ncbi:NADH:ubiquinone reductase (H(+)-translocating) [Ranunculus cassubicifolius]
MEHTYQDAWIIPFIPLPIPIAIGTGLLLFPAATKKIRRIWAFFSVLLLSIIMIFSAILSIKQINGSPIYQYVCDNYMSHDEGYLRFFAYMSFFNASIWNVFVSINRFLVHTTPCGKCLSKSLCN